VRHLRDDALRCTITADDGPPQRRRAQTVLVANVGRLQGGLELLPDARPDDGLLDLAVVAPRGPVDWLRVVGRVLRGSRVSDRRLERLRVRRVEVRTARPRQCEYDGDPVGRASLLQVHVEPGALTVLLPR
jgi:diacylglycerol kinase family enzyme